MKLTKDTKILIVGLGLIGGSYAMALTKQGYKVRAITTSQKSIDYAVEHNLIESGTITPDPQLISDSDLIIFALYPHTFLEWMEQNGQNISKGTLITDVTGVKLPIIYKIESLLPEGIEFIAAHPMAGREVYGVENATDEIFKDANYIVTPTENNSPQAIEVCEQLGRVLGFASVSKLSPEEHDDMIGFLSQLTHCIAIALMTCNDSPHLENYTGDSFRDLTRIAKINYAMWSELFILNKKNLIKHMEKFELEFTKLKQALQNDDIATMRKIMRKSTERRSRFDKYPCDN
ncbi:MAG TPA: prephenate dehydrogenase [Clostridiaceae bacterium]|nr:prephenate dehydrogenase [Clostridiaceae bacterium]